MPTQTQTRTTRPDRAPEPVTRRVERYLSAESAYGHARARRDFLAHAAALFGVTAWLSAARIGPAAIREAGLYLFPIIAFGFVWAATLEWWWGRRLRIAAHALDAESSAGQGAR